MSQLPIGFGELEKHHLQKKDVKPSEPLVWNQYLRQYVLKSDYDRVKQSADINERK